MILTSKHVLELTAREMYLLTRLIGNMTSTVALEIFNSDTDTILSIKEAGHFVSDLYNTLLDEDNNIDGN